MESCTGYIGCVDSGFAAVITAGVERGWVCFFLLEHAESIIADEIIPHETHPFILICVYLFFTV